MVQINNVQTFEFQSTTWVLLFIIIVGVHQFFIMLIKTTAQNTNRKTSLLESSLSLCAKYIWFIIRNCLSTKEQSSGGRREGYVTNQVNVTWTCRVAPTRTLLSLLVAAALARTRQQARPLQTELSRQFPWFLVGPSLNHPHPSTFYGKQF